MGILATANFEFKLQAARSEDIAESPIFNAIIGADFSAEQNNNTKTTTTQVPWQADR